MPGNHDYTLDPEYYGESGSWRRYHPEPRFPDLQAAEACLAGVTIIRDSSVKLHGLNFHGFPHIPEPHGRKMAFCHVLKTEGRPTPTMNAPLSLIPSDTDILAVHGPAFGYLDQILYGKRSVGSASLRDWALKHKPAVLVCGHIHEARGALRDKPSNVTFLNVACLTARYKQIEDAATVMDVGIPVKYVGGGRAASVLPSEELPAPAAGLSSAPTEALPAPAASSCAAEPLSEELPGPASSSSTVPQTACAVTGQQAGETKAMGTGSKNSGTSCEHDRPDITDSSYQLLLHSQLEYRAE